MVAINPLKADQQRPTVAALLVPMANGPDATRSQPMATYQGLWLWPNAVIAPGDIVSIPKATERSERYLFEMTQARSPARFRSQECCYAMGLILTACSPP